MFFKHIFSDCRRGFKEENLAKTVIPSYLFSNISSIYIIYIIPCPSLARPEALLGKPEKPKIFTGLFELLWDAIVLCPKTTSVPSEHVFSQAGEVLRQKRNRLID